jgi:hypothetical protein
MRDSAVAEAFRFKGVGNGRFTKLWQKKLPLETLMRRVPVAELEPVARRRLLVTSQDELPTGRNQANGLTRDDWLVKFR